MKEKILHAAFLEMKSVYSLKYERISQVSTNKHNFTDTITDEKCLHKKEMFLLCAVCKMTTSYHSQGCHGFWCQSSLHHAGPRTSTLLGFGHTALSCSSRPHRSWECTSLQDGAHVHTRTSEQVSRIFYHNFNFFGNNFLE